MPKRRTYRRRDGSPNKAQAIRDVLRKSGRQTPTKNVVATLAGKGVEVTAAHVSNVKAQLRRGGGARRGPKRGGRRAANGTVSIEALLEAKKLVDRLGSVANAQRVIEALVRLQ